MPHKLPLGQQALAAYMYVVSGLTNRVLEPACRLLQSTVGSMQRTL